MTREEAIEKLKSQRNVTCNGCLHAVGWCESHCKLSEAIDMAIEALKQQEPCGDVVSRQAAIDALQKCRKHCIDPFDSYHIDIQDAENELMKLPSAQLSVPIGLDLIDRKSAIAEVCKRECNESEPCKGECGAVIALEILPTIQAKPRSGHWIKDNTDDCPPVFKMFRICSECGCVRTEETKYCPNCGVYMEVNKNGTNR